MQIPLTGTGESDRITELKKYDIIDSITEKEYDDIAFLAALICGTPISLITFIEGDRQWFKSHYGVAQTEAATQHSFCIHAMAAPELPMVVPDARKDERFMSNPLVTNEPNLVFYAGVPLVSGNGFSLGTVCVLDTKPGTLNNDQVKGLQILAAQVMQLLELRKKDIESQVSKSQLEVQNKDLEQFAMIVAHDIKTPLTTLAMTNQLLLNEYSTAMPEEGKNLLQIAKRAAGKINSMVDNILAYSKTGAGNAAMEYFDLTELLESVTATMVFPKQFRVAYQQAPATIYMNKTQLEQVMYNLINNSIRYNDKPVAKITIRFTEEIGQYHFTVTDNGIGIPTGKQEKIFDLFTTAGTADVFGVKGYGIGLPSVKKIIEAYHGSLSVASEVGMGTVISFTLCKPAHAK